MWPASWLRVFVTIGVKFSSSFTKLLIQSVCERALTTAYFSVAKWAWLRSNKAGAVGRTVLIWTWCLKCAHSESNCDTLLVALNEPFPGEIIQ